MSLKDNKTFELFSGFMPLRNGIKYVISNDIYEVMLYEATHFKNFSPANSFIKWATLEVTELDDIPADMESLILNGGLYAVFDYKGIAKDFGQFMGKIFMQWMPSSGYVLDQRAHFNVLGDKYKNNHPDSEEEVWIPIKPR
jgi:AraC family transcriptional regulator